MVVQVSATRATIQRRFLSGSTDKLTSRVFSGASLGTVPKSARAFGSTATRHTHYETLSVPKNATKGQIKANFYKLSKQYHPDVNPSAEAKTKFHAASEAYSVLVDDRQRRAYDRTLVTTSHRHSTHPHANAAHDPGEWAFETRRRGPGATHAWGTHSRNRSTGAGGPYERPFGSRNNAHPAYDRVYPDPQGYPWSSPHVRRATGTRAAPGMSEEHIKANQLARESNLWRMMRVFGLLIGVAAIGGGWTANAG